MKPLPVPVCNRILLLVASSADGDRLFELAARLALQSPLCVIDAGNTFQGYGLARLLRRVTPAYEAALERITLSRVFTCYQMLALLSSLSLGSPSSCQALQSQPLLILDFLATFYDQGVPAAERDRLLRACIGHLRRLNRQVPLAVWVRRRNLVPPEGLAFLSRLQASAGQVWQPEERAGPAWKQAGLPGGW
jgi:hypothetical protein